MPGGVGKEGGRKRYPPTHRTKPGGRGAAPGAGGTAVSAFKVQALRELTEQQTRFAPPARRQEQVDRAERLVAEIDPGKQYPYQWVCFKVTEYRSDAHADLLIPGPLLRHDLALF